MTYTFKLSRRLAISNFHLMVTPLLLLCACTAGETTQPTIVDFARGGLKGRPLKSPLDSTLVDLTIAPKVDTLIPTQKQLFVAKGVRNTGDTVVVSVTWTATGGQIDSTGEYNAGSTPGNYRVIGTYNGSTLADTAAVTISALQTPSLSTVILTPTSASLTTGATQQFTASGKMSDGSTSAVTVTWSASGGTITSAGFYTAGQTAGTFRVIAAQGGGTLADTATVTVAAPTPTPPPSSASPCAGTLRMVNVSTAAQLLGAITNALPGDCINLAPGTYQLTQGVNQTTGGTAAHPLVIMGAGPATTIVQGAPNAAWNLLTGASYIQFWNFRLTNFFYGPIANPSPYTTTGGRYLVFDGMEIDHNQQQGLAIYNGASNGILRNSHIHHMGLAMAGTLAPGQVGEGVYLSGAGAASTDWQILNNTFDNFTAEAIDLSPGAHRTLVQGNTIDGGSAVYIPNSTAGLIGISANDDVIRDNIIAKGNPHGIVIYGAYSGAVIRGNHIDLQNIHNLSIPSFGVHASNGISPIVGCDNIVTNIPAGGSAYNVTCTP